MATRNIQLTQKLDSFVTEKIDSGQYANASEVVRAGLRALQSSEREEAMKFAAVHAAVLAGELSGLAVGDVVAEVRDRIRRRALVDGLA